MNHIGHQMIVVDFVGIAMSFEEEEEKSPIRSAPKSSFKIYYI